MAIKITSKKTRSVNNRPNCLKITKRQQKVKSYVFQGSGVKVSSFLRYASYALELATPVITILVTV